MRIGILTFHRSYNYGAYMQSYALSKRLQKDFPDTDIEIIDCVTARMYRNYDASIRAYLFGTEDNHYSFITVCKKTIKLLLDPFQLRRTNTLYKAFERDLVFLPLSKFHIVTDDYQAVFDTIRGKYDVIIVGSDCVWEFITYGFPNMYFLNDDLGAVKMSYAATSDRMHISAITEEQKEYINSALTSFSYLGIRDVATQNLLKQIVPQQGVSHNCDPTILLDMDDFSAEKQIVQTKLTKAGIDIAKPIIGLMCSDQLANIAIEYFGNGYQYVSVYWHNDKADVNLLDLSPREWSIVFSFFKLTITRFFHGTILSMKNGTPALTIDEWPMTDEEHISKLEDLYNRMKLKNHYCRRSDFLDPTKQKEILNTAKNFIDNSEDKQRIKDALIEESKSYLDFSSRLREELLHK